jgi:hypothetical protein
MTVEGVIGLFHRSVGSDETEAKPDVIDWLAFALVDAKSSALAGRM